MTEPGNWNADINGFGETLPVFDNKVTLDTIKKDQYGLPMIAIEIELRENEKQMRKDMAATAAEMLDKIGAKNIVTYDSTAHPGKDYSVCMKWVRREWVKIQKTPYSMHTTRCMMCPMYF